jgi:hypothetical protein
MGFSPDPERIVKPRLSEARNSFLERNKNDRNKKAQPVSGSRLGQGVKPLITSKARQSTLRHSQLTLAVQKEPDVRKSSHEARDNPHCKKRPNSKIAARSKGGGGGAKKYVPWCK